MKRFLSLLTALLVALLLSGCGDSDNDVSTISGSGDSGTAQPAQPAQPAVTESYPTVSGHGILWKPVSDSNKKLAVLLARSYGKPSVKVLDMNKNVIEVGRFVYYSNPNRATYRFGRPGRSFPTPCLIQVGSKIYKVPNPAKRYE